MSVLELRQRRVGSAIRLVDTSRISREEWLAARKLGIGASEAAAAIGINPYQTPLQLYRLKCGLDADVDLSGNDRVRAGIDLEDYVATRWTEQTGKKVERVNAILQSAEYPWMLCNLDRRVVGEEAILECKTAGEWAAKADQWGADDTDAVPMQYVVQVTHQMIVTGFRLAYLAVLIGGVKPQRYKILYDPDLAKMIIDAEREFWERVQRKDPPPPIVVDDVLRAFPNSIDRPIEATRDITTSFYDLVELRQQEREIVAKIDARKLEICAFMGEHDALVASDGEKLVTWRTGNRRMTFDAKAHAKERAACHAQFAGSADGSRTFLVKEPK